MAWTKFAGNPVISSSTGAPDGRDDTTAWLSSDGTHWLMAYGIVNEAIVYTTPLGEYANWTQVGALFTGNTGQWECPDFYWIPTTTSNVTTVVKASTEGRDYWVTGFYDAANVQFYPAGGQQMGMGTQLYDYGVFYASKRFNDPSTGRQILFGWVIDMAGSGHDNPYSSTWASTQTLPRSVDLDVDGVSLKIEPVEELQALRIASSHTTRAGVAVPAGSRVHMTGIEGQQLEIIATIAFNASETPNCGIEVLLDTVAGQESTQVGFTSFELGQYMVGMDLPGNDYNITPVSYTDPHVCQQACEADPNCAAWTFVVPGGPGGERCCLKTPVPAPNPETYCVSGVMRAANTTLTSVYIDASGSSLNTSIAKNNYSGPLAGVNGQITLHIFVDHSVVEVYTNAGRGSTVITNRVYPTLPTSIGVSAFASSAASCSVVFLEVWELAEA